MGILIQTWGFLQRFNLILTVTRDQLWNKSERYTCKLWLVVINFFKQEDNGLKTQISQVMETLMMMSIISLRHDMLGDAYYTGEPGQSIEEGMSSRDNVQDRLNLETTMFTSDQRGILSPI